MHCDHKVIRLSNRSWSASKSTKYRHTWSAPNCKIPCSSAFLRFSGAPDPCPKMGAHYIYIKKNLTFPISTDESADPSTRLFLLTWQGLILMHPTLVFWHKILCHKKPPFMPHPHTCTEPAQKSILRLKGIYTRPTPPKSKGRFNLGFRRVFLLTMNPGNPDKNWPPFFIPLYTTLNTPKTLDKSSPHPCYVKRGPYRFLFLPPKCILYR